MGWRYQETLLVVCTLGFFSTMAARLAISPVVPDIIETFEISSGTIGLALTGMWMTYAISQYPSGVLADKFGERSLILFSLLFLAPGSILLALSPNFATFGVGAVILGTVAGFHFVPATSLLTKEFVNTGRAIGVYTTGGSLGGLIAPAAAIYVAIHFGWRGAVLLGAVLAVPLFLLSAWRIQPTERQRPSRSIREHLRPGFLVLVLTRPEIMFMTIMGILCMFVWQATASFLPLFLVEYRTVTQTRASIIFSAYFGVLAISQPIMGELSDRYSRDMVLVGGLGSGMIGYTLLVAGSTVVSLGPAIMLLGVSMSWGGPLQSRFMDHLTDLERGTKFGLARAVFMMVGALGNVTVGILADVAGWLPAFGILSILLAIVVGMLIANHVFRLGL